MSSVESLALARHRPAAIDPVEWQCRLELAACYRLFFAMGWTESIYNHITLRVPGTDHHYLINPFGLNYEEVTARNLVKVNLAGDILDGSPHPINRAGFVIHSAIHAARDDAHCVIHTHTTAGVAVACKDGGLSPHNFYGAMLNGQIAYHEFEGITTDEGERPRLLASFGDKTILVLRNHGLLVVGPHVPQTVNLYWTLQRACEVQQAAESMAGPNRLIKQEVFDAIPAQVEGMRMPAGRSGQLFFDAMLRRHGIRLEDIAGG